MSVKIINEVRLEITDFELYMSGKMGEQQIDLLNDYGDSYRTISLETLECLVADLQEFVNFIKGGVRDA